MLSGGNRIGQERVSHLHRFHRFAVDNGPPALVVGDGGEHQPVPRRLNGAGYRRVGDGQILYGGLPQFIDETGEGFLVEAGGPHI